MKEFSKEKIYGIVGTVVFHLLLLLLLYLIVMERIEPQPEKSNIEMQSAVEDVAGEEFFEAKIVPDVQPVEQVPPPTPASQPETVKEPLVAQNEEQSIPVDTMQQHKERELEQQRREEEARKAREEAERKAREEAERKKKEDIKKSVSGAFGKSSKTSNAGVESEGKGIKGEVSGESDNGLLKGKGNGHGIEARVGNRSVVSELNRNIPVQEEGTVVVNVLVSPEGKVLSANAKANSTKLKTVAEREALKMKFNKVSDLTENETGTITFTFKLNY